MSYGEAPVMIRQGFTPEWDEFMHYLYLPVIMRGGSLRMPVNLYFLRHVVIEALEDHRRVSRERHPYVYVSARLGMATPGNPLNRPGWHCDDFGGNDLNYIWSSRYPTRFLEKDGPGKWLISPDDSKSMRDFTDLAENCDRSGGVIRTYPDNSILRLTPHVIHDTPIIPAPGGLRSFFKISISTHRYNLRGNSHNYLFDYNWPMYSRAQVRNQPGGHGDYVQDDQ